MGLTPSLTNLEGFNVTEPNATIGSPTLRSNQLRLARLTEPGSPSALCCDLQIGRLGNALKAARTSAIFA